MNRQIQKERRKELRSNATISEKRLWKFLNKKQQDFKFRRQHGIGPYIVDFYLANKKIAIEIDGKVHDNIMRQAHDQRREEYLQSKGIKIIRFSNDEVKYNIDDVIRRILFVCDVDWLEIDIESKRPPRPDTACARRDSPPFRCAVGGEIPETASVRLDFLATPHLLITSSP